jgi:F-type H+-transporting ATPase subunit a
MQIFKKNLANIQPQLVSLVIVVLILLVFTFVIYRKIKKAKVNEAPKGVLLLAEQYVMGVDSLFKSVAKDTITPAAPYIFTLFSFLLVGNFMGLIGFPSPVTSYSVPLVLGLIS